MPFLLPFFLHVHSKSFKFCSMKIYTLLICILLISIRQLNAQSVIIKNTDGTATNTLAPLIKKITFSTTGEMLIQKTDNTVSNYPLSSISYLIVQDLPMGFSPSKPLVSSQSIGLGLYPNPVANEVHVRIDTDKPAIEKIQIQSITGQIVQTWNDLPKANDVQFSSDNLLPGVYFCTIYTSEFSSVVKFIKQ